MYGRKNWSTKLISWYTYFSGRDKTMIYDINTIYLLCIGQGRAQVIHWSGSCPVYTLVRVVPRIYIGQGRAKDIHWSGSCTGYTLVRVVPRIYIGQGRAQDIHWSGSCKGYTFVRVVYRIYDYALVRVVQKPFLDILLEIHKKGILKIAWLLPLHQ